MVIVSLVLHIIFSTAFGLIVKDAQVRGQNLWAAGTVNYVTAAIAAWISLLRLAKAEPDLDLYQFSQPTLIIGVLAGVGYVVGYFFLLAAVKQDGISSWSKTNGKVCCTGPRRKSICKMRSRFDSNFETVFGCCIASLFS